MKKMNQVKQVLNTCSPLEKIVKINGVLGTGVNTLSKKLCSDCKHRTGCSSGDKMKGAAGVSGTVHQGPCSPCDKFKPPNVEVQTSDSDVPGCMPFTDDVPVRPIPNEEHQTKSDEIHPSLKNKGCGCNIGTTIPPED